MSGAVGSWIPLNSLERRYSVVNFRVGGFWLADWYSAILRQSFLASQMIGWRSIITAPRVDKVPG